MAASTKPKTSDHAPSFCVVTRIFDAELPYVGSFIRHYTSIGVRKFFFVNTHTAQFEEVQSYVLGHRVGGVEINLINTKDDKGPVNGMQNEALHAGMADFVINVDVDEYWVLPASTPDLRTLVKRRPADVYFFGWLMVPSDKVTGAPKAPYYGFHGHQCKYMVQYSRLRRLGIHRPYLKGGGGKPARQITSGVAVHFWGRSFKDVLLKVVGQKIGNSKTSNKEELMRLVAEGDIPNRLKLMAFFCRQPKSVPLKPTSRCTLLDIDTAKENELLGRRLDGLEFEAVHKMYLCFARRLRSPKLWATLPQYGTGLSDLQAVDSLEPIRAIPIKRLASKRPSDDDKTLSTPAKRRWADIVSSDESTAAETSPTMSESEQTVSSETSPPEA